MDNHTNRTSNRRISATGTRTSSKKRQAAIRRRKRVIRNRLILAAAVLAVIILIIVLAVSCSNKRRNNETSVKETETHISEAIGEGESGTGEGESESESASSVKKTYTPEEYEAAGVNELKDIPILMYHRIYNMTNAETNYNGGNVDIDGYNRTAEALEADLEYYYQNGYRMIRLDDYLDGYIDVEFGKSPVILTFDDGIQNAVLKEFDANGEPVFEENCAVDVLERMKKKYPDFNVTATFFLNGGLFENGTENDKKVIRWMIDHGYDIGNHTWTHPDLSSLSADEIEEETGRIYKLLDSIIPGEYVNIVALPYGIPSDVTADSKYNKLFEGTYDGFSYTSRATLLCAWTVQESPFSPSYRSNYIKRIRGYDNDGSDFDIEFNFALLNNGRRYVSDGNPDTIVIRKEDEGALGEQYGRTVITY